MQGAKPMSSVNPDVPGTESVEIQTGSDDAANVEGIIANSIVLQSTVVSVPAGSTEIVKRHAEVDSESQAQEKSSGKAKASKKQKYRKAG